MNYENRLVIFLDILGFRGIVKRTYDSAKGENSNLINSIFNAVNNNVRFFSDEDIDDELFSSKQITQFSDSIVISFILKDPGDIIFTLSNCLHLLMNLAWRGFLCRGGVAYGKLIHTDKIIFGPALVEAYDLEQKAALYPRVIISEDVLSNAIKQYQNNPKVKKIDLYYGIEQIEDFLVKDFDGLFL